MIVSGTPGQPVFDCEQTVRRLWDYLDGELDTIDLTAIDAHLAECAPCANHYAFERHFLDVVRAARAGASAGDVFRSAMRERVVSALIASGELAAPDQDS